MPTDELSRRETSGLTAKALAKDLVHTLGRADFLHAACSVRSARRPPLKIGVAVWPHRREAVRH